MTREADSITTHRVYALVSGGATGRKVDLVENRNPQRDADEAPPNAESFYYYDIATVVVDYFGEPVACASDQLLTSVRYFINGVVRRVADGDGGGLEVISRFGATVPMLPSIAMVRTSSRQDPD